MKSSWLSVPGAIARHWRGETPFWKSVLAASVIVPALAYTGAVLWLTRFALLGTPTSRMVQLTAVMALVCAVAVWQAIGTWRATARTRAPERWWITRWLSRGLAVAMAALGFLFLKSYPSAMENLVLQATDQDAIGQSGYSVTVEDANLYVTGNFAWGMLDAVTRELAANPGIESVVLNSPGGHVGVGTRIYALIQARKLNTYVVEQCASACLLAFLAGENRYLQRGARLGFHSVNATTQDASAAGTGEVVSIYRARGVSEPFIERMLEVPPEDVWVPKTNELMDANIVTELVD